MRAFMTGFAPPLLVGAAGLALIWQLLVVPMEKQAFDIGRSIAEMQRSH